VRRPGTVAVSRASKTSDTSEAPILLSIVLPTYNEVQNIDRAVQAVYNILKTLQITFELIVVDDDSPDGTASRVVRLQDQLPHLRLLGRSKERGLATAVVRGWQASQGEVLGVMDADLQHPAETLPELWNAIKSGADLAIASRHVRGGGVSNWSLRRRLISRTAQFIGLLVLPEIVGRVADPMSGYFLVQRRALASVTMKPRGYKILLEVLARAHIYRTVEVAYVFRERLAEESKATWRVYGDYLIHLATLRIATLRRLLAVTR